MLNRKREHIAAILLAGSLLTSQWSLPQIGPARPLGER
jgi:hypothetical protein